MVRQRTADGTVQVPRTQPLEIHGHISVSRPTNDFDHHIADGHQVGQTVERNLDAGGLAVVAHPEVIESQGPQARLGLGNLPQHPQGDRSAVGHPRRQACGGGLVGGRQPQHPRRLPDHGLCEPGVDEGEPGAVLGRGALTGSMVAQVVDLQAEYGVVDGGALTWQSATGDWAALDADEILQIRAIRVGVVTRHPQFEKNAVPAPPVPTWMGDATTELIAANANYRHRIFETVIPLRNVIWAP